MSDKPTVQNFTAKNSKGETVRFTVSTDLVDYMDSARTFGGRDLADPAARGRFQRRLVAVPDLRGEVVTPMLFSISSNDGFYLVRKDPQAPGEGWTLTNLKEAGVQAFDAGWTPDGRIAVAVAVDSGAEDESSRLFVAYDMSSESDWGKLRWKDCGVRPGVRATGVRVLDNGDRSWTVAVTGDTGRLDTLFLLRSDVKVDFSTAPVFSPAVDYQEVFDFEAIVEPYLGPGIAILGQSGQSRVLSYRPFPSFNSDGTLGSSPPVVFLACPEGANVLQAGMTINKETDLYIGGQGVHRIVADELDNREEAELEPIMSPQAAADVHELAVADRQDGSVSVWALLRNGRLVISKRSKADAWGTPLRLRSQVAGIAPVRGDRNAAASLLVVYSDGRAGFLLLDAATGTWRESPLLVANPEEVSQVTCYGTALRVLSAQRSPRPLTKVKVSASVLTNVILNGRHVFIGPKTTVEVETDANGCRSLYDRARSFTPALYRFQVEGVPRLIDVNPAGVVHERLSKISGDDLVKATVPDGKGGAKPLLPDRFRSAGNKSKVNGLAAALNQAGGLAMQTSQGNLVGINQVSGSAADFSSSLKNRRLSSDYAWGIRADAAGVQTISRPQIDSVLDAGRQVEAFFSDLGDSIADFFEGLWERVEEGWTFIVKAAGTVVEFICELGGKIKRFVLDTLEQVGSFFTWLWEQVKTRVEEVFEFLKFVFEWDDIRLAAEVMAEATREALLHLKESVGTMKDKAGQGFETAITEIRRWQSELGVVPAKLPPPAQRESIADRFRQVPGAVDVLVDQTMGSSAIGWVFERLEGLFDEIVEIEGHPGQQAIDAAKGFLDGLADDQFKDLENTWIQIQADIANVLGEQVPEADDFNFETFCKLVIAVGADAVVGLLTMVRDLVLRMLDLLRDLLDAIVALLFAKIRFPFIEKLMKLIDSESKADTSFRLIDAVMLLAAVPATIAYKLIFAEAPFKRGEVVRLPFGRVQVSGPIDSVFKFAAGFGSVFAAFFKFIKGLYSFGKAAKGDISTSTKAVVGGVVFGHVGLAAQVLTRHPDAGETVSDLEWAAVTVGTIALVPAGFLAVLKWDQPIDKTGPKIHLPHQVDAVLEIVGTAVQLVLGAVVFGFVLDRLKKSKEEFDRDRELPETLSWSGDLFDQAGTVMIGAATLLPAAAMEAKAVVLAGSAAVKGTAVGLKMGAAASNKEMIASLSE